MAPSGALAAAPVTLAPGPPAHRLPRRRPPGPLARLRRVDPLTGVVCAAALAVYLAHGLEGPLTRDVAVYGYGGQQVAEGVPPYVAIVNRAGPLAHLVPGIGVVAARLVGVDDVRGMRVLFLLVAVACVGLAHLVGRDLLGSRRAGIVTAAALLSFEGFTWLATYGPREKTLMVLFLLGALLAVVHQRWFAAGVLISLGTLTWQPVLFAGLTAAVVAALLGTPGRRPATRLRPLLLIAVGGLVPAAATVAAYALVGRLHVLLDDFLLVNARYTHQTSLFELPSWGWTTLADGYGASVWVLVVGVLALPVLAVGGLRGRRSGRTTDPRTAALVGAAAGLAGGVLWSVRAFNAWPDAFVVLPFAALGVGGLVARLTDGVPARVAVAATTALARAAPTLALGSALDTRDGRLARQRASVAIVLGHLAGDAGILSIEAPQPLVLAGQRNPSRFQLFGNGLVDYLDDVWPGGKRGYGRGVVAPQPPARVARGRPPPPAGRPPGGGPGVRRVGLAPGWTWYVRRDVGTGTIASLRAAIRADRAS